MVSGIIVLDTGLVQILGSPQTLKPLIDILRDVLPQLELEETKKVLSQYTEEQLQQLLEQKRVAHDNTRTNE